MCSDLEVPNESAAGVDVVDAEETREAGRIFEEQEARSGTGGLYLSSDTRLKVSNKKYRCKYCSKVFVGNIRRHIESVHLNIQPFKCRFCDRTFTQNSNRKSHEISKHHHSWNPGENE